MRALNEAWSILKDAARRSAFDTARGGTSSAGSGAAKSRSEDSSRPFWTGASGPPPGRPSGPVLDFGIFAGWSVGEIARYDRGYLAWLRDRPEAKAIQAEIDRLLNPDADDAERAKRGRSRR